MQQLHPIIVQILKKRGLTEADLPDFFNNDLTKLPDLTAFKDMDLAVARIITAMQERQKIAIYGDYDVDGTTSCALLFHFFRLMGFEVMTVQPSRFHEGYGLHPSSIDWAVENKIDLMITVDCGISSVEAAEYALTKKVDLIITDHHQDAAPVIPPACAVINPNRRDETESPRQKLAGVGVAFCLSVAVRKKWIELGHPVVSLYELLPFVALGTICDLAFLNPMNLCLTRHGLKIFPKTIYPGLAVFLEDVEKNLSSLPSEKLSFFIGPIINSKGRLDHPELALKLLTSLDTKESFEIFQKLLITNNERKSIQRTVVDEAKALVKKSIRHPARTINVIYQPHWHEGVIGIVASQLVETFKIPCIVFTNSDKEGEIKASARSAGTLDIFECLSQCSEFFIKFGGHKAAAGLTMKAENFIPFAQKIEEIVASYPDFHRTSTSRYDIEVSYHDIDLELVTGLQALEPYGMGNPKPILRMVDSRIQKYSILKDKHVKWNFSSYHPQRSQRLAKIDGISFNFIDKWGEPTPEDVLSAQSKAPVAVDFCLEINRFNGKSFLQAQVSHIDLNL
jgi:single-stranded-DNA-specific exonuclease